MFGMTAGGMGGMGQAKHSIQECVLVGSANAEQARALHSRLEVGYTECVQNKHELYTLD